MILFVITIGTVFSIIGLIYQYNCNSKDTNKCNNTKEKDKKVIKENDEKNWTYPYNFFCPICINTLNEENKNIENFWIKFKCNHYIHYRCLYEYLTSVSYKKQCPLCRESLKIKHKTIESNLELFKFYCKMNIKEIKNKI